MNSPTKCVSRLSSTGTSVARSLRKEQPKLLDWIVPTFLLALAREGEDAFVVDLADLERELQWLNVRILMRLL